MSSERLYYAQFTACVQVDSNYENLTMKYNKLQFYILLPYKNKIRGAVLALPLHFIKERMEVKTLLHLALLG